jgi:hypothetical protein
MLSEYRFTARILFCIMSYRGTPVGLSGHQWVLLVSSPSVRRDFTTNRSLYAHVLNRRQNLLFHSSIALHTQERASGQARGSMLIVVMACCELNCASVRALIKKRGGVLYVGSVRGIACVWCVWSDGVGAYRPG